MKLCLTKIEFSVVLCHQLRVAMPYRRFSLCVRIFLIILAYWPYLWSRHLLDQFLNWLHVWIEIVWNQSHLVSVSYSSHVYDAFRARWLHFTKTKKWCSKLNHLDNLKISSKLVYCSKLLQFSNSCPLRIQNYYLKAYDVGLVAVLFPLMSTYHQFRTSKINFLFVTGGLVSCS